MGAALLLEGGRPRTFGGMIPPHLAYQLLSLQEQDVPKKQRNTPAELVAIGGFAQFTPEGGVEARTRALVVWLASSALPPTITLDECTCRQPRLSNPLCFSPIGTI